MAKRQTRSLTPAEAVRQGRKLIAERRRQAKAAAQPEATIIFAAAFEAPKPVEYPDGAWPIADLRTGQCRFACTADDAQRDQHRFCGRPTRVGRSNLHGSWCDEHLPRVWGEGSMAERIAHQPTRRMFG